MGAVEFSPVFSSNGHGRKTHMAIGEASALCGIEARHPHLFWDRGESQPITNAAEYVESDAGCGYGCELCKALLLKHAATPAKGESQHGN